VTDPADRSLATVARALRDGTISAVELTDEALRRHERFDGDLHAYKLIDREGARAAALRADRILGRARAGGDTPPPLCGIPISVKDLYGMDGLPTWAGTARRLPERWSSDGWLIARLREQGAVFVGKTHTVELAYGALGVNPHWETPRNPWDAEVDRVPGGSSAGAGVSLQEGSALIALGTDTGGSIRIPAAMTGTVGHRTTRGRWPTDGVVPLSHTLDTVGALTRSVADSLYFFEAVEAGRGDPARFDEIERMERSAIRVGVPRCSLWNACQDDISDVIDRALTELSAAGWTRLDTEGQLLDDAIDLYMHGGIAGAECRAFLQEELPGWMEILHPIVGTRLATAPSTSTPSYAAAIAERARLETAAGALFETCDVLALPTTIITPPPIREMDDLERYVAANAAALRATCGASILGLCAVTLPVGLDAAGMPVGLQLVGPGGQDEAILAIALAAERSLGSAVERLGTPPRVTGRPTR
jgi:aspartyl-tRNA(Asn)/glutamyl-tRNA(Gln) amidotransferase subunit A